MIQDTNLTTAGGAPVVDDETSRTAGARGPLLAENAHLFEKLAHFNRERIPERVVHARGTGAYGTFTVTRGLSEYTIADFLQREGERTEVFVRFSTVGGGQDSSDYARDPRGFAVKFYTRQGNWDLVGNNTPVFFLRDPIQFPDFVHSQKKNPRTNLPDPAAAYAYWARTPQALHQVTVLMSDRGIPLSYRHMNGYSSHTLSMWNEAGERFWVKWHLKTDQGIRCLTGDEAAGLPPHGAQQDLVESIDRGDHPSWTVKVQVLTESQAEDLPFNPFDVTKVWPHAVAPLMEVGKLVLDRNVDDYFAETEQAAFSPSHLVPGLGVSPDRMLQARLLAYPDAHRFRLGANYQRIPVNAPRSPVRHDQRDGAFAGLGPAGRPESAPEPGVEEPPMMLELGVAAGRFDRRDDDNFTQAGELFRLLPADEKARLFETIAGGLRQAAPGDQEAMLEQFERADPAYAAGVRDAMVALV